MLRIPSTDAGGDVCLEHCDATAVAQGTHVKSTVWYVLVSTLLARSISWTHFGIGLESFWQQFGMILYSCWYHFCIILEVSVRRRKWIHFGARQRSGPEPTLTGNFPVKALEMEITGNDDLNSEFPC